MLYSYDFDLFSMSDSGEIVAGNNFLQRVIYGKCEGCWPALHHRTGGSACCDLFTSLYLKSVFPPSGCSWSSSGMWSRGETTQRCWCVVGDWKAPSVGRRPRAHSSVDSVFHYEHGLSFWLPQEYKWTLTRHQGLFVCVQHFPFALWESFCSLFIAWPNVSKYYLIVWSLCS